MNLRRFLFSLRWYLLCVLVLFLLSASVSFFFPSLFHFFDPYLAKLFAEAGVLQGVALFFFIVQNNLLAACVAMIGGIAFGIIPLGIGVTNGLVLGYVASRVSENVGIFSLWRLLPHGVFELPALFLALALGMRLGVASMKILSSLFTGTKDDFLPVLRACLYVFCVLVIPLLFIAGVIEALLITWRV